MIIHRFVVILIWTALVILGGFIWLEVLAEISKAEEKLPPPSKPWTVPLETLCRGRQKIYLDFMPGGYVRGPFEIWCMGDEKPLLKVRPNECFRMVGDRPQTVRCADG